ncbi:MAG TPA: hypothetical protein VJU61_05120, partial [Polyangiaceae bacterium]|nr:hypothetical protein [Polyangiaceae bacterium]
VNLKTIVVSKDAQDILNSSTAIAKRPLKIQLNPDFEDDLCPNTNIEQLPRLVKNAIAVHEIGHILGFSHPPPLATDGVLIPGTAASTNTSGSIVTYATVMDSGCTKTRGQLSSDDILSATKKYPAPSCRAVCEFNCTFNVDPGQIGLCQAACPQQCGG